MGWTVGIEPTLREPHSRALPLRDAHREALRPPGRNRTVICRLSGGCTSVVRQAEREAESRGVEPPDPSWAARLAGGHLAPMQDGLSRAAGAAGIEPTSSRSQTARAAAAPHPDTAEGEGVEPPRLIARPFSRRVPSPHWLVLPRATSRVMVLVGRVGIEPTSNGLRDRCNASVCYRPMVPPPGVEPGPSAFRADAQTCYARVGSQNGSDPSCGVPWKHPSSSTIELSKGDTKHRVPDPGVEPRTRGSEPRVLPLDQSGSSAAPRAQRSRSSGWTAREWGTRESNPAGHCGRRVYSASRLPYRSRAPSAPKARKPPRRSRWLLHASASRSTELREWSPPPGKVVMLQEGRVLTCGAGSDATAAFAAIARRPEPAGPVRRSIC